ncbi:MAG: hypothetical protein HRU09_16595 [Oligoflexales bacterium]|nr:hypothetical protein [Oligoflexales bacterium]
MNFLPTVFAVLFLTVACYDDPDFRGDSNNATLSNASEDANRDVVITETNMITNEEFILSAAPWQESSITFDHFNGYIEFDFEILRERTLQNISINTTQSKYRKVSETYTQGTLGTFAEQAETQNDLGMMDILVVVDNSGSMGDEHNKIKTKLPELVDKIAGFDWQVRVVSTSLKKPKKDIFDIFPADDKCDRFPVIPSSNPDAANIFMQQIEELGTKGDSEERGIKKAIRGITCDDDPWLRDGADLAVLFVTDEDSYRSFLGLGHDDAKPSELKALLNSRVAAGLTDIAKLYGIFDLPNVACDDAKNADIYYNELILDPIYGGYAGSICDPDSTATFEKISLDLRNQLISVFTLQYLPTPETVSIVVNGVALTPDDFTIDGNQVSLLVAPEPGSEILISYYHGGTERKTEFTLLSTPEAVESVTINGDFVAEDLYEIVTQDGISTLVFSDYPDDNAQIVINYNYEDEELTASFEVDPNLIAESISVKVDDADADFTVADNLLNISPIPPEGSAIEISYDVEIVGELDNVIELDYRSNTVTELSVFDQVTGTEISYSLEDRAIVLALEQVLENQIITVRYHFDQVEYDLSAIDLTYEIVDVILANAAGETKECKPEEYEVSEERLFLTCDFEDLASVTVNLMSAFESVQTLEVPVSEHESCNWAVWVNEQERFDYVQEHNKFTLENLAPEASITIICNRS